jgi:hypothetical protein
MNPNEQKPGQQNQVDQQGDQGGQQGGGGQQKPGQQPGQGGQQKPVSRINAKNYSLVDLPRLCRGFSTKGTLGPGERCVPLGSVRAGAIYSLVS